MALPTKAKITALVCTGRIRPKEVGPQLRLKTGQAIDMAAHKPASIPITPQNKVA